VSRLGPARPPGVLRVERDMIDVTSNLPRPDPDWTYTDRAGHQHRREGREYPTLVVVVEDTWWCEDCRDEHTDEHLECAQCGETIVPGTVGPHAMREYIPGLASYWLDDEPISEARYFELAQRHQQEGEPG
jgi:hypothetical protein